MQDQGFKTGYPLLRLRALEHQIPLKGDAL